MEPSTSVESIQILTACWVSGAKPDPVFFPHSRRSRRFLRGEYGPWFAWAAMETMAFGPLNSSPPSGSAAPGESPGYAAVSASLEPGSMDGAFPLLSWRTALDPCVREWNTYWLTRDSPHSYIIPLKTVQSPCWRALPAHLHMRMLRLSEGKGLAQAPELGLGPTPDTCRRIASSTLHFNYAIWKEFHQALPRYQKAGNQEPEEMAKRM